MPTPLHKKFTAFKDRQISNLLPSTTANLGELDRNPETSNAAGMRFSASALDVPLAELGVSGSVDAAAQFAEVLLDGIRVEMEVIAQVGGVGGKFIRCVTTQRT